MKTKIKKKDIIKIDLIERATKRNAKHIAKYCDYCKNTYSKIGNQEVFILCWKEIDSENKNRFSNNEHLFTETDLIKKLNEFITRKEENEN